MVRKLVIKKTKEIDASLEEIASDGRGSGLESDFISDDDVAIKTPFDPREIDVITQGRTVSLLLTRLEEGELDLSPDFQRRSNLWSETTKSGLIESLLLRIPIPSLYVAEDKAGNYTVVDGLQRICAIAHFANVAALNKAVNATLDPLRLSGLASLKEYTGKSFAELPRGLVRRINETELTLHIIRPGTPLDVKFNIFSRINRGGLPLTAQEIRNAVYRGEWKKYIHQMADSGMFKKATEGKIRGERMEDLELVLRFVALYSHLEPRHPDQSLDNFLNTFVEKISAQWGAERWEAVMQAFEKAMEYAPKIFGRIAFRKYSAPNEPRRPINRGIFETESVMLARYSESDLEKLSKKSESVCALFGKHFEEDLDFRNALLYATGRGTSSNTRVKVIGKILTEALNA